MISAANPHVLVPQTGHRRDLQLSKNPFPAVVLHRKGPLTVEESTTIRPGPWVQKGWKGVGSNSVWSGGTTRAVAVVTCWGGALELKVD